MKTFISIGALIAVHVSAPHLLAQATQAFPGADSFDTNERNPALWAEDGVAGNAMLVQRDGRIYHTITPYPAGVSDDIAFRFWNGKAPFSEDWSVQIDLHVPVPLAPLGLVDNNPQRYGFGMAVTRTGYDPVAAFLSSGVTAKYAGAESSAHQFLSQFVNAATGTYELETADCGAPVVSVRIRWEASSQSLFSEYDANGPTGGYEWVVLRSVPGNDWNMSAGETFSIFIDGFSNNVSISEANELYADNFVASTSAPVPITVGMRFATELFWNSPKDTMQQLQSSTDAKSWINVGLPGIGDGLPARVFDSSPEAKTKFYRVVAQ
jgi:hypothetical protein